MNIIISDQKGCLAPGSFYRRKDGKFFEKPDDVKILELEKWIKENPKKTETYMQRLFELRKLKLMAMDFYLA